MADVALWIRTQEVVSIGAGGYRPELNERSPKFLELRDPNWLRRLISVSPARRVCPSGTV